ncbi:MAG: hypothetical protein INH37_22235, partial [Myxococcaceae bacterium]|nr:hypothetical protein [Myxococcaceae bacterium]
MSCLASILLGKSGSAHAQEATSAGVPPRASPAPVAPAPADAAPADAASASAPTTATNAPAAASSVSTEATAQPRPPARPVLGADLAPRSPRSDRWDAWGEARLRFNQALPFGVDELGTSANQRTWLQSRLIAGGRWAPTDTLRFDLELEALSGYLAGDALTLGTTYTARPFMLAADGQDRVRVLPRKASLTWTTGIGQLV